MTALTSAQKVAAHRERLRKRGICGGCFRNCLLCGRDQKTDPHTHRPATIRRFLADPNHSRRCENCHKDSKDRVYKGRGKTKG